MELTGLLCLISLTITSPQRPLPAAVAQQRQAEPAEAAWLTPTTQRVRINVAIGDPDRNAFAAFGMPSSIVIHSNGSQDFIYKSHLKIHITAYDTIVSILDHDRPIHRIDAPNPIEIDPSRPIEREISLLGDTDPIEREFAHDYLWGVIAGNSELLQALREAKPRYEDDPEIAAQLDDLLAYDYSRCCRLYPEKNTPLYRLSTRRE